jgi:hypothetical protein
MSQPEPAFRLSEIPATEDYCLEAQRIVTRTNVPMQLVIHDDVEAFVKSKTNIEGPTIHQYNWRDEQGELTGISCKLKSADHLNIAFGEGAAGPDGYCHDMNRQVYALLEDAGTASVFESVVFVPSESLDTLEQRSMLGPAWLRPFTLTSIEGDELHLATKGFVVEFTDPRYEKFPPTWRGTHYCHLVAPDYLQRLLAGSAEAGAVIGREQPR